MRIVLLITLLFVVATTVLAQSFSPRWVHPTNVEVMRFRQGVSPTADYAGAVDTWLDPDNTTTNYGTDATMSYDGTAGAGTGSKLLLNFDISALPDDAVITLALLRLHMASEGSASGDGDANLAYFRVARPWVENEVTWAARKDPVADSTWSTAGAADFTGTVQVFGDISPRQVAYGWNVAYSGWTNRGTEGGTMLSWGLDSLYSSHGLSGVFDGYLIDYGPAFDPDFTTAATDAPRWLVRDVTRWASMVHVGAWAPYGFYIYDNLNGGHTALVFDTSESATALHRPELVVYYEYAQEEAGSGGGGQGASTLGFEPLK